MQEQQNNLSAYFRKEELKISLPSKGAFYPPGTLELDSNKEVGVYPMTALDELTLKTPDGLLSGEATFKVIRSCVPAIKDPWQMPSIDVDSVLIGIRIASYGPNMRVTSTVPNTKTKQDHEINLMGLLDSRKEPIIDTKVMLGNGVTIVVKPSSYREMQTIRRETFEKQRLSRTINNSDMDEEAKEKEFNKIFATLTMLNVQTLTDNIDTIVTPEGAFNDMASKQEFVNNVELKHVNMIRKKVDEINVIGSLPKYKVQTPEEDVKKGAPESYEVPVMLDNSDFFAFQS
tara:strand:+ start:825 stop:1688 length:864 start_codon:yes stop_codon:yes gene_type:complete